MGVGCIITSIVLPSPQIDKKSMHKAGMVQRVTNEVEIQCRLKHPSILEVQLFVKSIADKTIIIIRRYYVKTMILLLS